jgi:IstB-like ATP binding protein
MDLVICALLTKACDCIIVSSVSLEKVSVEVARRRLRITFFRAADLVRTLTEARRENAQLAVSPLVKSRLILRELGVVSFKRAGGENLLDLLSERNEIHSTLVTTGR